MLAFLAGLLRVMAGFFLACLTAGAITVMFAVTPAELIDADAPYWQAVGGWMLYTATITAVFACPFAILAIVCGEWSGIRSLAYYGVVGIFIAILGFITIVMGESPAMPSVINAYAAAAFLTMGLISGVVYWLFSGRFAYQISSGEKSENAFVLPPYKPRAPASPAHQALPPPTSDEKYKA